ncbi:Rtt107p RNJ42_01690 [Nakaseomyces bracarensis]|uniref:Rtt107p n=1 Tax=Nakaseomyces bracarensis TaxID=273131 RepID=UPI0038722A9A
MTKQMGIEHSIIFDQLNFLIVVNSPGEEEDCKNVADYIKKHGASNCEMYHTYKVDYQIPKSANIRKWFLRQDFNRNEIHIVVSNSSNFQLYPLFEYELMIPVVTSEWVSLCVESQRHVRTSNFSPNPKFIFKNYQMLVSKNAFNHAEYFLLSEIIHCLGGTTVDYITRATTHIIATSPTDPAITTIERYMTSRNDKCENMDIKYVLPTWISQCFLESYLVSINDHLILPTVDKQTTLEKLNDIWDDLHGFESLYNSKKKKILSGKSFKISTDIELNGKLYRYFTSLIRSLGGNIIQQNHEDGEDIQRNNKYYLVLNNEIEDDFDSEQILGKGNILWIINMWNRERFFNPDSNILFTALKRKIFKKKELVVTYTNYFGVQRLYLQRLIEFLGGSATMELSKQNTHLICNMPFGKKYEVAEKWKNNGSNIVICSHRWLEECYKAGKKLPLEIEFLNLRRLDNTYKYSLGQLALENYEYNDESEEETDIEDSQANPFQFFKENHNKIPKNDNSLTKVVINQSTSKAEQTTDVPLKTNTEADATSLPSTNDSSLTDPEEQQCDSKTEHKESKNGLKSDISRKETGAQENVSQNNDDKDTFFNEERFDTAPSVPIEAIAPVLKIPNDNISSKVTERSSDIGMTNNDHKALTDLGREVINSSDRGNDAGSDSVQDQTVTATAPNNVDITITKPDVDKQNSSETKPMNIANVSTRNEFLVDVSSAIGNRRAKAQAAKRLHEDIESLNEHEKNSNKKRKVRDRNGALLLPEEIKQLERIQKLKEDAKEIILTNKYTHNQETKNISVNFNINAICTGFATNDISDVHKQLLELLGVHLLHDDIDKHIFEDQKGHRGKNRINTIISPKKARTVKFLKALSLSSLTNFLQPEFLFDLIDDITNGRNIEKYKDVPDKYRIEGITDDLTDALKRGKVFDKAMIHAINVVSDLKGGPRVIIDILKCHGVKEAAILSKNFTIDDITTNKKKPNYILVASTKTQANKFKKTITPNDATVLIVNWDWCVNCIFNSKIDYNDKQNIFYSRIGK